MQQLSRSSIITTLLQTLFKLIIIIVKFITHFSTFPSCCLVYF